MNSDSVREGASSSCGAAVRRLVHMMVQQTDSMPEMALEPARFYIDGESESCRIEHIADNSGRQKMVRRVDN